MAHRVVFVEDDPDLAGLISDFLSRHEMDVVVDARGDTAMATIEREAPDMVLLDIMLPGKDGLSICRELRPIFKGPIVMLTSLDSDMNQILGLELGANDYILKTTPPSVLVARLRAQLRNHVCKGTYSSLCSDFQVVLTVSLTSLQIELKVTGAATTAGFSTPGAEASADGSKASAEADKHKA